MSRANIPPGQRIRVRMHGSPFVYLGTVELVGSRRQLKRLRVDQYESGHKLEQTFTAPLTRISQWEIVTC